MHWSDVEEIATGLEEAYVEEEIPEYNLGYLKEMVLSLPEFEDQEVVDDLEPKKYKMKKKKPEEMINSEEAKTDQEKPKKSKMQIGNPKKVYDTKGNKSEVNLYDDFCLLCFKFPYLVCPFFCLRIFTHFSFCDGKKIIFSVSHDL